MKGLEVLETYCSAKGKKEAGADQFLLTNKVDLLYGVYNEMKTLDKKELKAVKKQISDILDSLCNEATGAMLTRLIFKVHEELFVQVDKSLLPQFFDKELQIIASTKIDHSIKINHLYLIGKIYQRFAGGMMTAPTSEILTAILKLLKTSTEWYTKESVLICLRRIIKSKSTSISNYWAEILKSLNRVFGDESVEVRLQVAKCYKQAGYIMKGASLVQFYDSICQVGIRGFEDSQCSVREQYVETVAIVMSNRLQEAASPDSHAKSSKKKAPEPLKTILDVYNSLGSVFAKDKNWLRECCVLCIWKIMQRSPEQLKLVKPLAVLQLELTWLSKDSGHTFDSYRSRLQLSWLFTEYTKLLDLSIQMKLKDTILVNLSKILERANKGQQQANDQQIVLILSALSSLILQLGSHIVDNNGLALITDIINPFLSWQQPQVRLAAMECVKALMNRCRTWICQLLSFFLNMTTVAHAELAALTPGPLLIVPKDSVGKGKLQSYFMALTVQSSCLACLLYYSERLLNGVPLDIANSALISARRIILGQHQHEPDSIKNKEESLEAKKHAGWIIIQGLLGLGTSWVSSNLSTFIKMWSIVFTKETCIITEESKETQEKLAQDFIIKAEALRSIHDFIDNYKSLLNQQIIKLLAVCLTNCAYYLFQNPNKEPKKNVFNIFPTKYLQMKIDIWNALGTLPTHTYDEIFVTLLHSLADAITTSTIIPTIYNYWEPADELLLITKDDQITLNDEALEAIPENFIEETDLRLYNLSRQLTFMQANTNNPKIRLVNAAIKVYTNIFCNLHLSQKNRFQLCKHLQACLTLNDGNGNKQFTIVVLCYSIARHLSKSSAACEAIKEPDQVFMLLQSMAEFACTTSNHSLRILGCELLALLHRAFSEVLSSTLSNLVTNLSRLADASDVLSRSKAALVAGYLFKHFDNDKLFFFIKPIVNVIKKQLNNLNALSKFNGFFAVYLGLKYGGSTLIDSFKDCLLLCLDNYNTDIRIDKGLFSILSRIFALVLRISPSLDQGKLPVIAFDNLELSHCNHPLVSLSVLQFVKHCLLSSSSVITPKECIEMSLRNLKNPEANTMSKKLGLEILGIAIHKGNYKTLLQIDPLIIWKLLEELNTIKGGKPGISYAYDVKQVKKLLELNTWKLNLEKSFGINNDLKHDSTKSRFSELLKKNVELIYQYTLKQLVIYIFMKMAEQNGEINKIIEMIKHVLNYRIRSEEELEELKSNTENKEGIVSKEKSKDDSYKFHNNIRMGLKSFVIKLLTKLIMNETRESELSLLVNHFPLLLSLSFSFINIENNPKKQTAFMLIKAAIKQCKDIKDVVQSLNDEEETSEQNNALEQYEAQIDALIRRYATKSNSFGTLESLFTIFYYLCCIPISRSHSTLMKLMIQLTDPLKNMSLTGSIDFSCEKDALKCHFKRLKILCKLYFVGSNVEFTERVTGKEESQSKFLKEPDRDRILKLFTADRIEENLAKHIMAALNDCWFILTQNKKVAKQKTNYKLIHSGVPSAFSAESCESAVLCFLKYLSFCANKKSIRSLLKENVNTFIPFILHYLAKKPEISDSPNKDENMESNLAESLLNKNDLLLALGRVMKYLNELNIPEDLITTSLELMEKLTDTKIMEFSLKIINIVKEICKSTKELKVISLCEEILGKIWLQSINSQTDDENKVFDQMHNQWKSILLHYASNTNYESQFQITFNTLITNLVSSIPTTEIKNAKLYARLCINTLEELSPYGSFVKVEMSQFLQTISSLIQSTEKIEVLFIIAMKCAISLAIGYTEDTLKAFSDFLEIFDITRIQSAILKAAIAIIKEKAKELKANRILPMILEHMMQQLYKAIETGECNNVGQKLQLVILLYETMDIKSENFFRLLFTLHLGFTSKAFSNSILKDVLNSMNYLLNLDHAYFKAAVRKLTPKEVKYLELLLKSNASNKIT